MQRPRAAARTSNYTSLCTATKTAARLLAFAPAAAFPGRTRLHVDGHQSAYWTHLPPAGSTQYVCPSTVRCHSMACRRLASLRRLLGPFDTRCLVSHLRQLDVEEVSFKSPGNAQFARLSNEKRKKHLHPAAPRSEPAWRHYPGQFRCPLRPRQSGDGSAIPPQITRLALDGHCYLLRYCANSRGHDASSTPVLPRRAWRVAPMLLGTLAVSVTGLPPQK
jgi:hypothetical protein